MIDETAEQLQKLTNSVASGGKEIGLDINVKKTKCMKIDPCNGSYVATEGFCYLGSIITDTGSCDKEVTTRIGKANSAFIRSENTNVAIPHQALLE